MSEENSLAESAYELINSTDGESQDGRLTESVGSLDYPPTDDVHSINGSEGPYQSESNDDDDDDDGVDGDDDAEQHSSASSIRYADQALQNPSTPPPNPSLPYRPPAQAALYPHSIEFLEDSNEDGPANLDKISVKHTIREFSQEEAKVIADGLHMPEHPGHLVAAIRQTMSPSYLSTREPLRVLYQGSLAARMDIIYKISSAICASGPDGRGDNAPDQSCEGVFNIFPISEFGSSKLPDVHLLESSGRQIRVEDCTSAEESVIGEGSFPGDTVYSITVDKDKTYKSLHSVNGLEIQPRWSTLPHIAIFFCTESDDESIQKTRNTAWAFMNQHGIPAIFITNVQSFHPFLPRRWDGVVGQHTVHLCLESRDTERCTQSYRLPIDLASFLNIDARQMNRNLAYVTGLVESSDMSHSEETVIAPTVPESRGRSEEYLREHSAFVYKFSRAVGRCLEQTSWLIPAGTVLFLGMVAAIFSARSPSTQHSRLQDACIPTVSPRFVPSVTSVETMRATQLATTTVMANVTSTKTVRISDAKASASTFASALSFAGFLSDEASSSISDAAPDGPAKRMVCSAELHGSNEILVRIPFGKKTSWLAKGAIDIDVYRGGDPVKTKLSSIDEGILVELNMRDAYGVVNISIITSKRPKINETFGVDFGKPIGVEALEAGLRMFHGILDSVANAADNASTRLSMLPGLAQRLREDAVFAADDVMATGRATHAYLATFGARSMNQTRDLLNSGSLSRILQNAQEQTFGDVSSLREDVDMTILRAQIASKLLWLSLQGKTDEYEEYEHNATQFLRSRHKAIATARTARSTVSLEEPDGAESKTRSKWRRLFG